MDTATKKGGTGGRSTATTKATVDKNVRANPLIPNTPQDVKAEKLELNEWTARQKTNLEIATSEVSKHMAGLRLIGANPFELIDADVRLLNAELTDTTNEIGNLGGKLAGYGEHINNVKEKNISYQESIENLNTEKRKESDLINELEKLRSQEVANTPEAIKAQEALIIAKHNEVEAQKLIVKGAEDNSVAKKKERDDLNALTLQYETDYDKLIQLEIARDKIEENIQQKRRDRFKEQIQLTQDTLGALSSLASGFADLSQGNMDLINAEYDRYVWSENEKIQSSQAREDALHVLDVKRWEALQRDFEAQKKWKEAQAWMDFASGSVGIWTAPGITALAPFGYIAAGIQQAALLATTIGNVKSIRAQQMLKPQKGGNSGAGGTGGNIPALNPHKEALTSKEENLNTMMRSNGKDMPQNVVRVTDINNMVKKVEVRDSNSTL
jgi:hypothetical protein